MVELRHFGIVSAPKRRSEDNSLFRLVGATTSLRVSAQIQRWCPHKAGHIPYLRIKLRRSFKMIQASSGMPEWSPCGHSEGSSGFDSLIRILGWKAPSGDRTKSGVYTNWDTSHNFTDGYSVHLNVYRLSILCPSEVYDLRAGPST